MNLRKITEDLSDAKNALIYVISIRGRIRSPDLEPIIAKSCNHAMEYALYVIAGRFELGEPAIARSARNVIDYSLYILEGRFEMGEAALCKPYCSMYLTMYIKQILREPSEKIEKYIVSKKDAQLCVEYVIYSSNRRFLEAEEFIVMDSYWNKEYISHLLNLRNNN
jgi:hypothetical protein